MTGPKQLLGVIFASWLLDFNYSRVLVCALGGFFLVAAIYWLALPRELPLWPGALAIMAFGALGVFWESRAR